MTNERRRNIKQYSIMTIANFGSMGLAFVTNILMTTMLSETAYGSYRYVINVILMLVSLTNFGVYYSAARLLTKAEEERHRYLYGATVTIMIGISLFGGILLFVGFQGISFFVRNLDTLFLYALPLISIVMLQRTFINMLKGSNRVFDIAFQTVFPQIIMAVIYVIALFIGKPITNFELALAIYTVSFLITDVVTLYRLKISPIIGFKKEYKTIQKEQKANGGEIYKGSLLSVFSGDALNVIVGSFTSKAEYAVYTLALSFSAPMIQVPATMGIIQFKKSAKSNQISKRELVITSLLGILAYAFLNFAMFVIFPFFYQNRYQDTAFYVSFLSLGFLFHGMGDYFNQFLSAHGEGSAIKKGAYASGGTLVVLGILFIPAFGIWGLTFSRIIASIVYFVVMIVSYLKYIKKQKIQG